MLHKRILSRFNLKIRILIFLKGRKLKIIIAIAVVLFLYVFIMGRPLLRNTAENSKTTFDDVFDDFDEVSGESSCTVPKFKILQRQQHDPLHLATCKKEFDRLIYVKNGKVIIESGHSSCFYQKLIRIDDYETLLDEKQYPIKSGDAMPHDYIRVTCEPKFFIFGGYTVNLMGIVPKREIVAERKKIQLPSKALGYDVAFLGYDSVSRLSFMTHMPKSFEVLTKELNATIFKKHNIIGDGTTSNLIGMLTGKYEAQLPEARKAQPNSGPVDDFPWIFKEFNKYGYMTLHAEDHARYGSVQYRLNGWKTQPTDHYARPYYVYELSEWKLPKILARHKIIFDLFNEMYTAYDDVRKMSFIFHAECSHDKNHDMVVTDDYFSELLKQFKEGGKYENTILFVFSDHGARFSWHRNSLSGRYEERLPFLGIHLPTKLQNERPEFVRNLRKNSIQLTGQRDIYPTLLHILGLPIEKHQGYQSLFDLIPSTRTCEDAQIRPHWCACTTWETLSLSDSNGQLAVKAIVNFINEYTKTLRSICSPLQVQSVTSLEKYKMNPAVLSFQESVDFDGFTPNYSDNRKTKSVVYRITFVASPGEASYEATAQMDLKSKEFIIKESEISRTNAYAPWIKCLDSSHPEMRKFCICKSALQI